MVHSVNSMLASQSNSREDNIGLWLHAQPEVVMLAQLVWIGVGVLSHGVQYRENEPKNDMTY